MSKILARARLVSSTIRYWVDYFAPREILSSFAIVFAFENVVNILFERYWSGSELVGWLLVGVAITIIVGVWGYADEDKEEVKKKVDDRERKIEEETGEDL